MTADVKTSSVSLLAKGDVEKYPYSAKLGAGQSSGGRQNYHNALSGLNIEHQGKSIVGSDGTIYVEFAEGDRRNPMDFSLRTKWVIMALTCTFSTIIATTLPTYNIGFGSMMRDLNCTEFQATIGFSVFVLGMGIVPLVTTSFSEEFGRRPIYIASAVGLVLTSMMIALSKNIQTVILARFLQGTFGSTGTTMVGGTMADIWSNEKRGFPMSVFAVVAVGGGGLGPIVAGWVEINPRLEWRWIQWYQMILFAAYLVLAAIFMKETRSSILLTRLAKKIRKETGNDRYRARIEDERPSLRTLIHMSCTRPIYLMFTEPIVLSISLWIGFVWGIVLCLMDSIPGVFSTLHGFNVIQIGGIFTTMMFVAGWLAYWVFNELPSRKTVPIFFSKYFPTRGPEARLYWTCFAALLSPASMFMFAWSSFASVHWIAQAIAVALFTWATFIMYLGVFTYLADCYGPYASSALAGQNLSRNIMGTVFPLFTNQMFRTLGYNWANSLFGFIGLAMAPIPYALYFYGPAIRRRSKFCQITMKK